MSKIEETLNNADKSKGFSPGESASAEFISEYSSLDMKEDMIGLYSSINSLRPEVPKRVIQFIGSRQREGTSTIAREFAIISVAEFGKTVLLLDMEKPDQHRYFKITTGCSLEDVLRNGKSIEDALCRIGDSRLFISAITKSFISSPLVFESLMGTSFREKLHQFDLVIIDSPSAAVSPDGLSIASMVDGVVLVLEAEKTRWPMANSIKEKIIRNGGKILGIVFNKRRHHIPGFIYKRL